MGCYAQTIGNVISNNACLTISHFRFQAIEEEGGNPDEIVVHLEITPKKTPRRTPKGKKNRNCLKDASISLLAVLFFVFADILYLHFSL